MQARSLIIDVEQELGKKDKMTRAQGRLGSAPYAGSSG